MLNKFLIIIIIIISASNSFSQNTILETSLEVNTNREIPEFENKLFLDNYYSNIFNYGKNGILYRICGFNKKTKTETYVFVKYDLNFKFVNEVKYSTPITYKRLCEVKKDNFYYVLFKNESHQFKLICYDIITSAISEIEGTLPNVFYGPDRSGIVNDWIVCELLAKGTSHIMAVNIKTGESKLIPIVLENINPKRLAFLNMEVSSDSKELFLTYRVYYNRNFCSFLVRLDQNLDIQGFVNLSEGNEKLELTNANVTKYGENKYFVTGNFGGSPFSSYGIYFAELEDMKLKYIKLHKFENFDNFFAYQPEKTKDYVGFIVSNANEKNDFSKFNYKVSIDSVLKTDDGYLLLAEAFFPIEHDEFKSNSNSMVSVFYGNKITHGIIAKISNDGEIIWNKTFNLTVDELTRSNTIKYIHVKEMNNTGIDFSYYSNGLMENKKIDGNGKIVSEKSYKIDENLTEKGENPFDSKYRWPWYDNYFLFFWKKKDGNSKDFFFYFNKIKY